MTNTNLTTVTVSSKLGFSVTCLKIEAVRVAGVIASYESAVAGLAGMNLSTVDYLAATDAAWDRTVGAL
jgi:hypothetical protein